MPNMIIEQSAVGLASCRSLQSGGALSGRAYVNVPLGAKAYPDTEDASLRTVQSPSPDVAYRSAAQAFGCSCVHVPRCTTSRMLNASRPEFKLSTSIKLLNYHTNSNQ